MKKILLFLLPVYFLILAAPFTKIDTIQLEVQPAYAQQVNCDSIDPTSNTCPEDMTAIECMRCFAERTGTQAQLSDVDKPFPVIIGDIIRGLLGFLGVIFLVLILYGGFLWMTSAGKEEQITKAKKIIANSAVGLFIIVVSYALTTWIFDVIIKATVTN